MHLTACAAAYICAGEAAAAVNGTGVAASSSSEVELEWCARGLLKLSSKVALLITMNVLADVLVDNATLKAQLMNEVGEQGREKRGFVCFWTVVARLASTASSFFNPQQQPAPYL